MASNLSNKKSNKRLSGQTSIQSFFKTTKAKVGSNDENQDDQVVQNTETRRVVQTNGDDGQVVTTTLEDDDCGSGRKAQSDKVGRQRHARASANKKKHLNSVLVSSDDDEEEGASSGSEYAASIDEEEEDMDLDDFVVDEDEEAEEEIIDDDEMEKNRKKTPRTTGAGNSKKKKASPVAKTPAAATTAGRVEMTPYSDFKTPKSSYTEKLKASLESPMTGGSLVGTPEQALKFSQRESERFPFLQPDKIKDKKMRSPSDPNYDPTTLYIPPNWFKTNKISEGQKQWWEFKSQNFDSVLMFKVGKFYELYEMDAHIGAECLGLSYMKGDQPHVGFPEVGYAQMAERLARAGHRVSVVEQVETPEMLAARNAERKKSGLKRDTVVKREKVAVVSRATMTDGDMVQSSTTSDSDYLACIVDSTTEDSGCSVGFIAVDVASARVILGQFKDDELRSHLRAVLTALKPVEVVIPRDAAHLSAASRKVIKGILRNPLFDERPVGDDEDNFYTASLFWKLLKSEEYFQEESAIPEVLQRIKSSMDKYTALCLALGGMLASLKRNLCDKWVMCCSKFQSIEDVLGRLGRCASSDTDQSGSDSVASTISTMTLDGAALENLEILENGDGGVAGTLLGSLDHCVTPFGRRRLREWLCRPLFQVRDIIRRQDAIRDLMEVGEEAAGMARKMLSGVTDIERAIVRLCASGLGVGSLRESSRVILYEDVSKKKIKSILATLSDLRKTVDAVKSFSSLELQSDFLRSLVAPGSFPDVETPLENLMNAVDWKLAEETGRIQPAEGTDAAYDAAQANVKKAQHDLDKYLESLQSDIKNGSKVLRFTSLNKEAYVLEAPDSVSVPSSWESIQGKKGVKRYMTDELKKLSLAMSHAIEEKEVAQAQILQHVTAKFASYKDLWLAAVDSIANLDSLMSLARAAMCSDGIMCRPEFIEHPEASPDTAPVFRATSLRHPAGISGVGAGGFVPNDVHLGGEASPFMLLTGPNMGGKSTIMRQVCLATIAAQIGAWVPAEHLALSPVDAVFVRMGAKDHIMLGQSTFFIELSETAAALHRATKHSLVALDELGRGTATVDGSSIASSVLQYLSHTVKCRGIFATHYHNVAESFEDDAHVALKHMACTVRESSDGSGVDDVIFLYQLTAGACPKSYGANVAKLAGLPIDVVSRAATISSRLDHGASSHQQYSHLSLFDKASQACKRPEPKETLVSLQARINNELV
ncbi:DNA mismatch repair protein MSH6 [Picochlorum sp. SENEW3]|nr:DNA mismatch repair protein MSH6 [Picochlorum sp. SENEW3]